MLLLWRVVTTVGLMVLGFKVYGFSIWEEGLGVLKSLGDSTCLSNLKRVAGFRLSGLPCRMWEALKP